MTTVTIELSQADRGRIDALLQRLEQLLHAEPAPVAPEPEAPVSPITPTDSTPDITPEQMQQRVVQLVSAADPARKKQIRAIVKAYAPKVSDIPADKLAEVWAKLDDLEG